MTLTKSLPIVLSCSLLGALVAACGSSATPANAPATDTPAKQAEAKKATPDDAEASAKFDEMSAPEKMEHMKTVVAPGMAKVFQSADAEKYADFGCVTCHGPSAKQGKFSMPSDALPALNMAEMDWENPVVKFMSEKVVPEMASLLGEEPYSEKTPDGFGCMGCHTQAK